MSNPQDIDFSDPSSAGNFLQRYHQVRNALSPPSSPRLGAAASPASPASAATPSSSASSSPRPIAARRSADGAAAGGSSSPAKTVWGSVFHPLGRSPTSASRYDLSPGQVSQPGYSASEIHAKGTGISLDERTNE